MQPPLPTGTLLQSRYRIVRLLGQGGFGRTYQAEDQGRFNESCAIKEFVPQQGKSQFSTKATQLFQREANILYQIQHPQIPQFKASFEVEQRLFLVQDYVEGLTYRELLNQRRSQNSFFSEAEVRQFLQQMLPVLAHIHAKGIIHRDISPDNIILRSRDRLPVLIDFGVVKEVVTRVHMATEATYHSTTVGKPGYAPSEQMQSGRAYPSSDLYSLAITAMVLLTGKEPQDLFDDVNLTWHWENFVSVSPGLAQVLNKATSYRPGDRYQSVSEMARALGAANQLVGAAMPPAGATPTPYPPAAPPPSQMRTVAVGRPYQPTTVATSSAASPSSPSTRSPVPSVLDDDEGSVWENPWAVGGLFLGFALVAFLGAWGLLAALNSNQQQTVQSTEEPRIDLTPDESTVPTTDPDPSADEAVTETTPQPAEYNQSLNLEPGQSRTVRGSLNANEILNYQVSAEAGQQLLTDLQGDNILMTVLDPEGNPVNAQAERVLGWTGELPVTGQYTIRLTPVEGVQNSRYRLRLSLEAAAPDEETPDENAPTDNTTQDADAEEPVQRRDTPREDTPSDDSEDTSVPEDTAPPEEAEAPSRRVRVSERRVRFPSGSDSILVADGAGPENSIRYVINLDAGETLTVSLQSGSGPATLSVLQNGNALPGAQSVRQWNGTVSDRGDYAIEVTSSENTQFTLSIEAR